MAESDLISAADFDLPISPKRAAIGAQSPDTLKNVRRSAERLALTHALSAASGNVSQAARLLGISRPTMYELMRTHDVRP